MFSDFIFTQKLESLELIILDSALSRHQISQDQIKEALSNRAALWYENEDPVKILLLGFDKSRRLLEIALTFDNEQIIVFHAMKARKKYLDRLDKENGY